MRQGLQPGRDVIHPLLAKRDEIHKIIVVIITSDSGLAGAYNTNVVRFALDRFRDASFKISYIIVGRKGLDLLSRQGVNIHAEFSNIPSEPTFADVSAIGCLAVDDYVTHQADEVDLIYTDFINMLTQIPTLKRLLPLACATRQARVQEFSPWEECPALEYIYEPGQQELLDQIVPSFTSLQLYQAILESQASEHAARMVAMQNATENASELVDALRLAYNKARQQSITSEMLDIIGGARALDSRAV
jgi:F-type H+-transporting ATPase subunit gamma